MLSLSYRRADPRRSSSAVSADEETARSDLYQMFQNQGPDYYGDFDELNSNLLEAEREAEIKGSSSSPSSLRRPT